jgi:hypothetical protein
MKRHEARAARCGIALGALLILGGLFCAMASDHADTPATPYRAGLDSTYFRGGHDEPTADSTPDTTYTTGTAYTDGVHAISFYNAGSVLVKVRLDGVADASTFTFPLPASGTYLSVTQFKVTTVSLYAASPSVVYVTW